MVSDHAVGERLLSIRRAVVAPKQIRHSATKMHALSV